MEPSRRQSLAGSLERHYRRPKRQTDKRGDGSTELSQRVSEGFDGSGDIPSDRRAILWSLDTCRSRCCTGSARFR